MLRPLGQFLRIRGTLTEVAELASSLENSRAHRFPKIINNQQSWPVFKRHLQASGLTEKAATQVLEQGTLWIDSSGRLHEQPRPIQQALAEGLTELRNPKKAIEVSDLRDAIISGEEVVHQRLSGPDAARVGRDVRQQIGRREWKRLLEGIRRMYGYHRITPGQILIEELLAKVHFEHHLGNSLRLLNRNNEVFFVSQSITDLILFLLTPLLQRHLAAGPGPNEKAVETVTQYYRTKERLRSARLKGRPEPYRESYRAMQKIERELADILDVDGGRQALLWAAQLVIHSDEFKATYTKRPTSEVLFAANRPLPASLAHEIRDTAEWLTAASIPLLSEREKAVRELIAASQSVCLTRFLPSEITPGEPTDLEIEQFEIALELPALIPARRIEAMVTEKADRSGESMLLMDADIPTERLGPVWGHEATHFLARRNELPIASSNEVVPSMVDGLLLAWNHGPQALWQQGSTGALFERGRQLFRDGGSIVNLESLINIAIETHNTHLKQNPVHLTETEQAQMNEAHEALEGHATTDDWSSVQRLMGYLVDGYLWEKAWVAGLRRIPAETNPVYTRVINKQELDRSLFDFMRQVVALEFPRTYTEDERRQAETLLQEMFLRTNLLTSMTKDPAVRWEVWQPRFEGDQPAWRYVLSERKDGSVQSEHRFQYVPEDLLRRTGRTLEGFVYNLIFRGLYSFQVLPDALAKDVHLWALWNQLEQIRVLPDGLKNWRGIQESIDEVYSDRFARLEDPEIRTRFQSQLPYLQFIEAAAYEAWFNDQPDPRVTDPAVREALEKTREARRRGLRSSETEHVKILQADVYPHLQGLLDASRKEVLMQQQLDRIGDATKLRDLSPLERDQIQQKVQEALERMTASERRDLMDSVDRDMALAEQRQGQGMGSTPRPNLLQPMQSNGSMALPDPGHEQAAREQASSAIDTAELTEQLRKTGEQAAHMANRSNQLAQLAKEARQAAEGVEKSAEALQQQAGSSDELTAAQSLAEQASQILQGLEEIVPQTETLDQQGQAIAGEGQDLQQQAGKTVQNLVHQLRHLSAQAAAVRARAEGALEQNARPLQAHVDQLAQRILEKEETPVTPDQVRHHAREAQQQAGVLEAKLQALTEKLQRTEETAQQASENLSQGQSTKPAAKGRITGTRRIRPLPVPPASLQRAPKTVPRTEPLRPAIESAETAEDPARLQQAADQSAEEAAEDHDNRETFTAQQESVLTQYFDPLEDVISRIRHFFNQLFKPVTAAQEEHHQRRGHLENRDLVKLLTEDLPRAYSRPGRAAIPHVKWSLLVDISDSTLEDESGKRIWTSQGLSHETIKGVKLEYEIQTAMAFQEALLDRDGKPRPGHESEIIAFTSKDVLPKTGWKIVKTFKETWSRQKALEVMDSLLNLPHSDTHDLTALNAVLKRGALRPHDDHVVLVVTDGKSGQRLEAHIKGIREQYPKAKIYGIGVGSGAESVVETYNPDGIWVKNISDLPEALMDVMGDEMSRIISAWRKPRSSFASFSWKSFTVFGIALAVTAAGAWVGLHSHGSALASATVGAMQLAAVIALPKSKIWCVNAAEEMEAFTKSHRGDSTAQYAELYRLFSGKLPGKPYHGPGAPNVPKPPIYAMAQNIEILNKLERILRRPKLALPFLWGPPGTGKNYLLELLAACRNQGHTVLPAHGDMTEDEIFERRHSVRIPDPDHPQGYKVTKTDWELTEFTHAMMRGDLVVWDEMNKMPNPVRKMMNRVLERGYFDRKNGERVFFSKEARVVGTGNADGSQMSGEMISRFTHVAVPYLPAKQEEDLLATKAPTLDRKVIEDLVAVAGEIRNAKNSKIDLPPISTRELIMIVQHLEMFEDDRAYVPYVFGQVYAAPDDKPKLQRQINQWLKAKFEERKRADLKPEDWEVTDGMLRIGTVECPVREGNDRVVEVIMKAYEKQPTNLRRLQDMLKALLLKQPILLEGDSGTGKDWSIDVLMSALRQPLFVEEMNARSTIDDLFGWWEMRNNETVWTHGKVAQAVIHDGIAYLGEVNGAKASTQAGLHNFMQTRYIKLTNGEPIDATNKSNFNIVASANPDRPPYDVFPMEPAFRSRFKKIPFNYLEEPEEIELLIGFAAEVAQEMEGSYMPRAVIVKLVQAAGKARAQFKSGRGALPLPTDARTLIKWVQDLVFDPALYEGDEPIETFMENYGLAALPEEIQGGVRKTLEGILRDSDIGLDHIGSYQPVKVGDTELADEPPPTALSEATIPAGQSSGVSNDPSAITQMNRAFEALPGIKMLNGPQHQKSIAGEGLGKTEISITPSTPTFPEQNLLYLRTVDGSDSLLEVWINADNSLTFKSKPKSSPRTHLSALAFVWMEWDDPTKTFTLVLTDEAMEQLRLNWSRVETSDGLKTRVVSKTQWLAEQADKNNPSSYFQPAQQAAVAASVSVRSGVQREMSLGTSLQRVDWSKATVNTSALGTVLGDGASISDSEGQTWELSSIPPTLSADGSRLWALASRWSEFAYLEFDRDPNSGELSNGRVRIKQGGRITLSADGRTVWLTNAKQVLELDRHPISGELSNARVRIKEGDPIPGMPEQSWILTMDAPSLSSDGTRFFVRTREGDHYPILELDRDPTSGELSNARVRIQDDDLIPGMPGKTWSTRDNMVLSTDGTQVWVPVALGGVNQILELDRDPGSGELSNGRVRIRRGDLVPGMPGRRWELRWDGTIFPSVEGTRLWVADRLGHSTQIVELQAPKEVNPAQIQKTADFPVVFRPSAIPASIEAAIRQAILSSLGEAYVIREINMIFADLPQDRPVRFEAVTRDGHLESQFTIDKNFGTVGEALNAVAAEIIIEHPQWYDIPTLQAFAMYGNKLKDAEKMMATLDSSSELREVLKVTEQILATAIDGGWGIDYHEGEPAVKVATRRRKTGNTFGIKSISLSKNLTRLDEILEAVLQTLEKLDPIHTDAGFFPKAHVLSLLRILADLSAPKPVTSVLAPVSSPELMNRAAGMLAALDRLDPTNTGNVRIAIDDQRPYPAIDIRVRSDAMAREWNVYRVEENVSGGQTSTLIYQWSGKPAEDPVVGLEKRNNVLWIDVRKDFYEKEEMTLRKGHPTVCFYSAKSWPSSAAVATREKIIASRNDPNASRQLENALQENRQTLRHQVFGISEYVNCQDIRPGDLLINRHEGDSSIFVVKVASDPSIGIFAHSVWRDDYAHDTHFYREDFVDDRVRRLARAEDLPPTAPPPDAVRQQPPFSKEELKASVRQFVRSLDHLPSPPWSRIKVNSDAIVKTLHDPDPGAMDLETFNSGPSLGGWHIGVDSRKIGSEIGLDLRWNPEMKGLSIFVGATGFLKTVRLSRDPFVEFKWIPKDNGILIVLTIEAIDALQAAGFRSWVDRSKAGRGWHITTVQSEEDWPDQLRVYLLKTLGSPFRFNDRSIEVEETGVTPVKALRTVINTIKTSPNHVQMRSKLPELEAKLLELERGGTLMSALLPVLSLAVGVSTLLPLSGIFAGLSLWLQVHSAVLPSLVTVVAAFAVHRELKPLFPRAAFSRPFLRRAA